VKKAKDTFEQGDESTWYKDPPPDEAQEKVTRLGLGSGSGLPVRVRVRVRVRSRVRVRVRVRVTC